MDLDRTWIIGSADEVAFERYPYDRPFTMAYVQLGSAFCSASNSETDFSSTTSDMGDASPPWQCVYICVLSKWHGRAIFSFGWPRASFGRPLAVGRWLAVISCSIYIYIYIYEVVWHCTVLIDVEHLHLTCTMYHSLTVNTMLGIGVGRS